jgi:hypothetical protein
MFQPSRKSKQTLSIYSLSITSDDVSEFQANFVLIKPVSVNSLQYTRESNSYYVQFLNM